MYSSGGQKSKISLIKLKSRHRQHCIPPGSSREEGLFLSFQIARGCLHLLANSPFYFLQNILPLGGRREVQEEGDIYIYKKHYIYIYIYI